MGKMRKNKPSFFKVILDHSIQKLRIPPAFIQNFNDINPRKKLFLKVSTRYWEVRLKRFENELCFGKGWKSFVKDNCIEQGDFVVFKLVTGSVINVTIYDKTCCEKKRLGRKEIVENHETLEEKSVKPDANAPLVDCGAKQRNLEGGLEDANGRECCIYFTKIFRHGKMLKIPRKLAKKIGDELKDVILVKVPSGDYCKVNLGKVHNHHRVSLGKGWESFVSKHSITDGHLLIFNYIGNSCFHVLNLDFGLSQENYGVTESSTGEPNVAGISQTANEEKDHDDEVSLESLVFTRVDRCETRTDSVKGLVHDCEEVESINTSPEHTNNHIKGNKHKAISARKSSNRLFLQNSVGKPKKPASAYMVFMEDFRITYKILYPNNRLVTEVAKAGGEKWKSMSDVDKAPHFAEAKKRSKEHYENLKVYFKNLAAEKSEDGENSCNSRLDLKNDEMSASEEQEEKEGKRESTSDEKDNNEETEEVSDEEVSKEAYNGEGDTEEISEEEDEDDSVDSKDVSDEEDDDSEDKDEEASLEEDDDSEKKDEESDEEASLKDDDLEYIVIDTDDDASQD